MALASQAGVACLCEQCEDGRCRDKQGRDGTAAPKQRSGTLHQLRRIAPGGQATMDLLAEPGVDYALATLHDLRSRGFGQTHVRD
jgi:hypothetical protein